MRDVAEHAGVSFKTVSRVVNREAGVRPELFVRVEDAIGQLGYRPDHRASQLRRSDSAAVTIGFVLVDVANPFFGSILRGIEEVAASRNCLVFAGSTEGSEERENQLIEAFVGRRVDGLIVVPSGAGVGVIKSEIDRGTPVVFLDIEPELDGVDLVRSDHFQGAQIATEHLLAQGHTDIAYFGDDPDIASAGLRLRGFFDAMSEAGLTPASHRVVTGSHTESEWKAIVLQTLQASKLPTAIFSAQNYVTIGAAQALHELSLQERVAQIGFDDVELADVIEPGLSVVPQHPRNLGRRAAEVLFSRLDGDTGPAHREIISNPITERGSGEIEPQP